MLNLNPSKTLVLATLFALAVPAMTHAHSASQVTFVAGKTALTGPARAQAGYVRLTLDNQDDGMRAHGIFRVQDGADLKQARGLMVRAFGGGEVGDKELNTLTDGFYGGAVFVPPGTQGEVGVTLKPGTYVIYADEITERGPILTPEYINMLEVTPATTPTAELPTPDYTLKMVDHAFAFPAYVEAGAHLWRVENLGRQEHMMFVSKLLPGKTLKDVLANMRGEAPPATEEETFGIHAVAPGVFNDATFNLEPGEYAATCFVTDPKTGTPHAMLGMTQTFTVAATKGR